MACSMPGLPLGCGPKTVCLLHRAMACCLLAVNILGLFGLMACCRDLAFRRLWPALRPLSFFRVGLRLDPDRLQSYFLFRLIENLFPVGNGSWP